MGVGLSSFIFLFRISGSSVETYFEFRRPLGVEVTFAGIIQRANSPFLLAMKSPNGNKAYIAEVNIN